MNRRQARNSARRRWQRAGTEILELALLLPLLLGLTFGTCEFGYYFFLQHNLQGAAREGARAAIPYGATQGDAETKVSAFLSQAGLDPSLFTPSFSTDPGAASPGTDIIVTIDARWGDEGIGIRMLGFIDADKIVRGRAVMRKEG